MIVFASAESALSSDDSFSFDVSESLDTNPFHIRSAIRLLRFLCPGL